MKFKPGDIVIWAGMYKCIVVEVPPEHIDFDEEKIVPVRHYGYPYSSENSYHTVYRKDLRLLTKLLKALK